MNNPFQTMHSCSNPFGVAVTSEEEAQEFMKDEWFGADYVKVRIFETWEEAKENLKLD